MLNKIWERFRETDERLQKVVEIVNSLAKSMLEIEERVKRLEQENERRRDDYKEERRDRDDTYH